MEAATFDFVVLGAGMVGASVAWELSANARVLVLEQEDQPGYHATGRSAAAFIPSYGSQDLALRGLTAASYPFLMQPPQGFSDVPLLHRRGLLTIASASQTPQLLAEHRAQQSWLQQLEWLEGPQALTRIPQLQQAAVHSAMFEPDVFDIDVDALHQGYLRGLRQRGSVLQCKAKLGAIRRRSGQFVLDTAMGEIRAPVLVNATGAWADEVARQAGAMPVGLQPLRRTAVLIDPPQDADVSLWPLLHAQDGSFYAKPDAGALLVSPADEHPSAPGDVSPEELDIAVAIHKLQQALDLDAPRVRHAWAGLRSFVPDRTPVIGMDQQLEGFFWLCGQGGHGIQTAPAAAGLAAALLLSSALPAAVQAAGIDPTWVSPARLAARHAP